jgi:hypothetical protein
MKIKIFLDLIIAEPINTPAMTSAFMTRKLGKTTRNFID